MRAAQRGVTLIEMLVVVSIIALMAAVSAPAVTSGLETLRLRTATDDVVSLLNIGLNRAERMQSAMEIEISKPERTVTMRSADAKYERRMQMPDGVTIEHVFPEVSEEDSNAPRRFLLLPGGTVPKIGLQLRNAKGRVREIRIDPITGTAQTQEAAP